MVFVSHQWTLGFLIQGPTTAPRPCSGHAHSPSERWQTPHCLYTADNRCNCKICRESCEARGLSRLRPKKMQGCFSLRSRKKGNQTHLNSSTKTALSSFGSSFLAILGFTVGIHLDNGLPEDNGEQEEHVDYDAAVRDGTLHTSVVIFEVDERLLQFDVVFQTSLLVREHIVRLVEKDAHVMSLVAQKIRTTKG